MIFESLLPWWLLSLVAAGAALAAYAAYARPVVPIPPARQALLIALRLAALTLVIVCLMRPVALDPPVAARDTLVPILIDVSRSMRLPDANGRRRIDQAADLVRERLLPALSPVFETEVLTFGERLVRADDAGLRVRADDRWTDVAGALRAARERYRGRPVAGLVLVSDGGDTSAGAAVTDAGDPGWPIFTVGVGSSEAARDRELLGATIGEAVLDSSLVELAVSAVGRGLGGTPLELRLLENGRPIDVRRVSAPDGAPVREGFLVSPVPDVPTVYTVEIPPEPAELTPDNNARSLVVTPPGRGRRILVVEGAPGHEHSFMRRALAGDAGLEVDTVVRKGRNDQGEDTFFIQAAASRTAALAGGYPSSREALFDYDAMVLGNIGGDAFTREQLAMAADFVAVRGGGLIVLGRLSFAHESLAGTPLEPIVPAELGDPDRGVARASARQPAPNRVSLTPEGALHPIMRLTISSEENRRRWWEMPPLAGRSALGLPRPGASILAVTHAVDGTPQPLVAVQRYGQGRALAFAGEASWRWKMMRPAGDRTYDTFWRQAVRWVASAARDPVSFAEPTPMAAGDEGRLEVLVRDRAFAPVRDATVTLSVTAPGGKARELRASLADPVSGLYRALARFEEPGVYRLQAEARRGQAAVGEARQWMLVGGENHELADPRLNADVLRRISAASGGQYLSGGLGHGPLLDLLQQRSRARTSPVRRDVWNTPWVLGTLVTLLCAEWVLRRRSGLR